MNSFSRVYYMDNLRAFAMLLGVFFHAALAYGPLLGQVWLTASAESSVYMDIFAYFSHGWRMPLFFIVAGFFAALLYEKRGLGTLIRNRILRIVLPFVIFLPLVIIAFVAVIGWAIENTQNTSPMLGVIVYMSQIPDAPAPPLTTGHLWFLYNLTFFYFIAVCYLYTAKRTNFNIPDWALAVSRYPKTFIALCPLLLVPALLFQHVPLAAPEQFMPQLWSFGFFGVFFVLGWKIFQQPKLIESLQPYMLPMLGVGTVCYVGFYALLPAPISMQDAMVSLGSGPKLDLNHTLAVVLEAYIAVHISLATLIIGKQFFDKQNKTIRLISDASYWIYIIHLPVLWVIQFKLLDTDLPMFAEFLISTLGTIAIGFISYVLLVRWTPIGWLLNGRKNAKKSTP